MIFKKINTFLKNYLNGNKFSKFFLAFIFILINDYFIFDSVANVITAKDNIQSVPSVTVSTADEAFILYQKRGLPDYKIYTKYFPPKNTYNNNVTNEHTLESCGIIGGDGLDMIGKDCMIKIPFDCTSPPAGTLATSGTNCLNYSVIFGNYATKKLNPKPCPSGGAGDKINCLSIQKPYCHTINNPILAINCKLAPCNAIPNQEFRRPGVNCLADCNDTSIAEPRFYIEGFNCLSSCRTSSAKTIGENCVLEFNNYVMPLCNKDSKFNSAKHFNVASTISSPREQCLDVVDLPICRGSDADNTALVNCVPVCSGSAAGHKVSCINFSPALDASSFITRKCHHYQNLAELNANPNCDKLNCNNLSISELKNSFNDTDLSSITISNQKYCMPTRYTNFSLDQFKAINTKTPAKAYRRDYELDNKPCYSQNDTEAIETILSSSFYGGDTVNNKIYILKDQCKNTVDLGCNENKVTRNHSAFNSDFLYDKDSLCKYVDVSEQILCSDYKKTRTPTAPFDCDANNTCSPSVGGCLPVNCPATPTPEDYCYKNGINCNLKQNQIYDICKVSMVAPVRNDEDPYVSWFFRPTISSSSIRIVSGNAVLANMSGYPMSSVKNPPGIVPNDNMYMTVDNLLANDKVNTFWGTSGSSEVPGVEGYDAGVGAVGPANICGMNSNYRSIPGDEFAYFRGEVNTVYDLDDKISHNVEICIRYVSSSSLTETCGSRRCRNTCVGILSGLPRTCTKICGYDVCKTLSIVEGPKEIERDCGSNEKNFTRPSRDIVARGVVIQRGFGRDECIKTYERGPDVISKNTRVRIFKPDGSNYICAVLEFDGITTAAFAKNYFDGDEFFEVPKKDGTYKKLCVSGTYVEATDSCVSGFDTNKYDGRSSVWRTARIIKYITAPPYDSSVTTPIPSQVPGQFITTTSPYTDGQGGIGGVKNSLHIDPITKKEVNQTIGRVDFNTKRYFETSDCIKHKTRVGSPVFFSKATLNNSERLFLPKMNIEGICEISTKTSAATSPATCDPASKTDFFEPSIKILYGKKSALSLLSNDRISLSHNYKIIEITEPVNVNTEINGQANYSIKPLNIGIQASGQIIKNVILVKESRYDPDSLSKSKPVACLYSKNPPPPAVAVATPATPAPAVAVAATPATPAPAVAVATPATPAPAVSNGDFIECVDRKRAQEASIDPAVSKNYDNLNFPVRFLKDGVAIGANTNIILANLEEDIKNKEDLKKCTNIEQQGYKICIKRDECSVLNNECVENEKKLINDEKSGTNYASVAKRRIVSNYCKNELLLRCNAKKGFDNNNVNARYKTLDTSSEYGFNANSLGNYYGWFNEVCIVAGVANLEDPDQLIYVQQEVIEDGSVGKCVAKIGVTCSSCNNANGCTKVGCCNIVGQGDANARLATPHELGYCVTLNNAQSCPALSYGINTDITDRYFLAPSYLSAPNISHEKRETNTSLIGTTVFGHAEYEVAYPGNVAITGKCSGFFKDSSASTPTANCSTGGVWSFGTGSCERYSCSAKIAQPHGANSDGNYNSNYDSSTIDGSQRGYVHGYANWNAYNRTDSTTNNINKKTETSIGCIPGYKKAGATYKYSNLTNIPSIISSRTDQVYSLFETISGTNNDGTSPTRDCNQIEQWEQVTNPCQRITCPALNFTVPAEAKAVNLNDYTLNEVYVRTTPNRKVLYGRKLVAGLTLSKVKIIPSSALTAPVYLNAGSNDSNISSGANSDFVIKNLDGSSDINLEANKAYVLEKVDADGGSPAYWKKLDNSQDEALKYLWEKSGGATFPEAKAIRSTSFYYNNLPDNEDKHTVEGACKTEAGYEQLGQKPQFTCDSKGNWKAIKNRCVSNCEAITSPVAEDSSHGFAIWAKADRTAFNSTITNSISCSSPAYQIYPYEPLYDVQGVKKDFGINAVTYTAESNYDAIATLNNSTGSYEVSDTDILTPSEENFNGTYYNIKIGGVSSGSSVVGGASPSSINNIYYLTNDSITLNAGSGKKWSKIDFSSFGKPVYDNGGNLEQQACHNPYSKFIIAQKCIGQNSCTLTYSDFTAGFASNTGSCTPSLGNGIDGIDDDNADNESGAGGGNGGGNINTQSATSNKGYEGDSYYDSDFHLLDSPPNLESGAGANFGPAVDLNPSPVPADPATAFDGRSGSVVIEEYSNATFSGAPRQTSYTNIGISNHTVSGDATATIYVKYTMIGGGGGGGGPGTAKGGNGGNGSKIIGRFAVKGGTVLKVHVGGGGKAGKMGNKASGTVTSFLNPQLIQPNNNIFAYEKPESNFLVKALRGIGSLFISEGYAIDCPEGYHVGEVKGTFTDYLACFSNACTLQPGAGYNRAAVKGTGNITCATGYKNGSTAPKYVCKTDGGNATVSGSCTAITCTASAGIGYFDQSNLEYTAGTTTRTFACNKPGYSGTVSFTCKGFKVSLVGNACVCDQNGYNSKSSCDAYTCMIKTTQAQATGVVANKTVSGAGSVSCDAGYVGSISYYCLSRPTGGGDNSVITNNTCTPILCSTAEGTGYNAKSNLAYSSAGSFNCDKPGYDGQASYRCTGTTNPGTFNLTSGCCLSGYRQSGGSCVINSCSLPTTNTGFPNITVSGSGNITCATGYKNGSTAPTYACNSDGTVTTNGTCVSSCSSGQELVDSTCTTINCTATATNTSDPYLTQNILSFTAGTNTGTFNCKEGYYGTVSYTCNASGEATNITPNCTRIQCTLPESVAPLEGTRTVNYSATDVTYSCSSGYRLSNQVVPPNYTCTANDTQINPSTLVLKNECLQITCDYNYGGQAYTLLEKQTQTIDCKQDLGDVGSLELSCSVNGMSVTQDCQKTFCQIPSDLNTNLTDGDYVEFNTTFSEISCREGFYYTTDCGATPQANCGVPKYKCLYNNEVSTDGTFVFQGSCNRIKCRLPVADLNTYALNSTLDGQEVNWTNSFVSAPCKDGFYQDGDFVPQYSCYGSTNPGQISVINQCKAITCNMAGSTTYSAKTLLEYGSNKQTACDKIGYYGTVTYNCLAPMITPGTGIGTLTINPSGVNCIAEARVRSRNVQSIWDLYVRESALSASGGIGGKITDSTTFLKGGNGGASDNYGSGGGGGSASMLSIGNRIIAIAGGGGGGVGGGDQIASNAIRGSSQLSKKLYSNVFGSYLITRMQNANFDVSLKYEKNSGNSFSLPIFPGNFVDDIIITSFGNPNIGFSVSPKTLTHGTCNIDISNTVSTACKGKIECEFVDVNSIANSSCPAVVQKDLAVVVSYSPIELNLSLKQRQVTEGVVGTGVVTDNWKIKTLTEGNLDPVSSIESGVYSFFKVPYQSLYYWVKEDYLGDDYRINITAGSAVPDRIIITFNKPNATFSPRLKIGATIYKIKRPAKNESPNIYRSLTIGYIQQDKKYVLTRVALASESIYTIREYIEDVATERKPVTTQQRTCMLDISDDNSLNVSWSRPNFSCISQCPGYNQDDRNGIGKTLHNGSYIKWDDANFGETVIKKFNGTVVNGFFAETGETLNPAMFRSGAGRVGNFFVFARRCGNNGKWEDPQPLCAISGGSRFNSTTTPEENSKSYIPSVTETFIRVNETANTECLEGYDAQSTSKIYTGDVPKQSYFCNANGLLQRAGGSDCIKYCSTASANLTKFTTISRPAGAGVVKIKPLADANSDGQYQVECADGYMLTGAKPIIKCVPSGIGDDVKWDDTVINNCKVAQKCYVSHLTKDNGEIIRIKKETKPDETSNDWFPLKQYLLPSERTNGYLDHGITRSFSGNGKCGYCKHDEECSYLFGISLGCTKYHYVRKYLKSYSCYDGVWSATWGDSDVEYRNACDGDSWDHHDHINCFGACGSSEYGGNLHPLESHLGNCRQMSKEGIFQDYNNLDF